MLTQRQDVQNMSCNNFQDNERTDDVSNHQNIPDELKALSQWVNWRSVPRKEGGKPTKPPYQPNGYLAKTDDPSTWRTYDVAIAAAGQFDGVGFVLTKDDPFIALDFDNCRCPALDDLNSEISCGLDMVLPDIAEHIRKLNSYTEVSPSGKGIRVFLVGKLPVDGKRKGPIEAYQSGRYVTVTGQVLDGFPLTIEHRQEEVDSFYLDMFGLQEKPSEREQKLQTDFTGRSWKEMLDKALESQNGEKIRRLLDGDYSAYPSQSEADLALCSHLAFWLGGDAVAINSAFRESGLYREKWDQKHHSEGGTYGEGTIEKALSGCHSFYADHKNDGLFQKEQILPNIKNWPDPLAPEAFHGIAGDFCRKIEPQTEADPAALLFQFLIVFGNILGRSPHFMVEATGHHCNEFLLLIGNTSKGRKGTSWDHVRNIAKLIDPEWESECIKSGLTSGEGLIFNVRDGGVEDKRLVAYESEFATVLKIIERKDNTLSPTMRDAWDRGHLRTLSKNSPIKATDAHISIVSHITKEELKIRLSNTESVNGFANRFLFACVKRSKLLPEGGRTVDLSGIIPGLKKAVEFSQTIKEMHRDEEARTFWSGIYGHLTREQPGILGGILARDSAHVVRLSMIYALLDCSEAIRKEHIMAALACWKYVESSVKFIFDKMTGDPVADQIFQEALAAGTVGITRTAISDIFKRNHPAERIKQAIDILLSTGKVRVGITATEGRPETRIFSTFKKIS